MIKLGELPPKDKFRSAEWTTTKKIKNAINLISALTLIGLMIFSGLASIYPNNNAAYALPTSQSVGIIGGATLNTPGANSPNGCAPTDANYIIPFGACLPIAAADFSVFSFTAIPV